ncbi:metal-dependent hydrolase [Pseudopedobacter sp.]|uniref:metal-dependent hydrolase n=1 Tax=Pseudopedobacter sp. TaxID=1936787 RepID=UPI003340144C
MKVNYFGHSCFLLQAAGKRILIDPFISPNELARDINIDEIVCDYILVSHGHSDHVADLIDIAKRTGATIISSFELVQWASKQGAEKVHPMNLGGSWDFDFGNVKMTYAAHSNSLPDGSYGGTAGGFLVKTENKTYYYSGDTALISDMKLLGELYDIDHAFLCIGDNFTMGVDDAIIAAKFINCKKIIGMHYDTFGYIKIDEEKAKQKFEDAGLKLTLMKISDKPEDAEEI